jgi:hypothetical protein
VKSQRYEGLLQVFDAKGKVSTSGGRSSGLGAHGDSKMVLRFTAPAEVKGVALLVVNHPDRASDQWMWTPGVERDRRIALQTVRRASLAPISASKTRRARRQPVRLRAAWRRHGRRLACWKIQSTPKQTKSSQYTKAVVWIRKDNYAVTRVRELRQGPGGSAARLRDFVNIVGIWTARQLDMSDLRRGSRTRLTLEKLQYNVAMKDEDFTLQALRRQ